MFRDITDVLNFRYHKKFLSWNYNDPDAARETLTKFPRVFSDFRIVIHHHGDYINKSVKYGVFCVSNRTDQLKDVLLKYSFKPTLSDTLVCAGEDTKLSSQIKDLEEFKGLFAKAYYEAKDIECDWVTTIPMGTNIAYTLRCGGNDTLKFFNFKRKKAKLIGTAFGSRWPNLDIRDRKELTLFYETLGLVENFFCEPTEYYEKLSEYKFFASPLGNGIQTPKICESIMCETVPVVTDHVAYRDLRDVHDLPLLIVDKWEDLTEDFLNDAWGTKYKSINWDKEKSKFLVGNFLQFYLTNRQ